MDFAFAVAVIKCFEKCFITFMFPREVLLVTKKTFLTEFNKKKSHETDCSQQFLKVYKIIIWGMEFTYITSSYQLQ